MHNAYLFPAVTARSRGRALIYLVYALVYARGRSFLLMLVQGKVSTSVLFTYSNFFELLAASRGFYRGFPLHDLNRTVRHVAT